MAERKVKFQTGKYYHVYNRGANRQRIFLSEDNYQFLVKRVEKYVLQTHCSMIAFCLMPNHYHFLMRQDTDVSISDCIQLIFNSYVKAFNKMYSRSGTLFEEKFKAIEVDTDEYIVHLCRYIHRNPLEAKLVKDINDWKYSNYLEWMEKRDGALVDRAFIKTHFKTAQQYEEFVIQYAGKEKYNFHF